jgi:hypothetical protein
MREKCRARGRAIANTLNDVGTRVDDEIAFVRMLADLDPVHIRMLKIMSRRPEHLDQVADQMNAADDPRAARQWYAWSLAEADRGLGVCTERCGCLGARPDLGPWQHEQDGYTPVFRNAFAICSVTWPLYYGSTSRLPTPTPTPASHATAATASSPAPWPLLIYLLSVLRRPGPCRWWTFP